MAPLLQLDSVTGGDLNSCLSHGYYFEVNTNFSQLEFDLCPQIPFSLLLAIKSPTATPLHAHTHTQNYIRLNIGNTSWIINYFDYLKKNKNY